MILFYVRNRNFLTGSVKQQHKMVIKYKGMDLTEAQRINGHMAMAGKLFQLQRFSDPEKADEVFDVAVLEASGSGLKPSQVLALFEGRRVKLVLDDQTPIELPLR